jgi:hypothetical protein
MGYMLRQIEKRARAAGHITTAPRPRHVARLPKPSALARAFAELAAHREDERAKEMAAARASRSRFAKPERRGAWHRVKALFHRRKV